MTTTPDADELRARQHLDQLGLSYAPEPPAPAAPPAPGAPGENAGPDPEPTPAAPRRGRFRARKRPKPVPAQEGPTREAPRELVPCDGNEETEAVTRTARRGGDRLPDWRLPKPVLTKDGPLGASKEGQEDEETAAEAEHETEDEEVLSAPEAEAPARARKPRRRPRFVAPGLPFTTDKAPDRRSLLQVARNLPPHSIWLLYTGSALATGFFFGIPQWVHASVGVLVTDHPTLTDAYSWQCWGLAAAVLFLDRRSRVWALPLSWAARTISASTVVGFLLYGVSTPISQLF